MVYLIQRARHHGIRALFTSREFTTGSSGSRSKTVLGASTGGFRRIVGNEGVTGSAAVDGYDNDDDDGLLGTKVKGKGVRYNVSASTQGRRRSLDECEVLALGQVRRREDGGVI